MKIMHHRKAKFYIPDEHALLRAFACFCVLLRAFIL